MVAHPPLPHRGGAARRHHPHRRPRRRGQPRGLHPHRRQGRRRHRRPHPARRLLGHPHPPPGLPGQRQHLPRRRGQGLARIRPPRLHVRLRPQALRPLHPAAAGQDLRVLQAERAAPSPLRQLHLAPPLRRMVPAGGEDRRRHPQGRALRRRLPPGERQIPRTHLQGHLLHQGAVQGPHRRGRRPGRHHRPRARRPRPRPPDGARPPRPDVQRLRRRQA